jgi:hypothetical protein
VLNSYPVHTGPMRNPNISFEKARSFASQLRTSRRHGGGWSAHADRDIARESYEIHVMAQSSHDRII